MAVVWKDMPNHIVQITDEPYVTEFGEKLEVGFHFIDETGSFGGGPFNTADRAVMELERYCKWLDTGITPAYTPEQIRIHNIMYDEVFRSNIVREKQIEEVERRAELARDAGDDSVYFDEIDGMVFNEPRD